MIRIPGGVLAAIDGNLEELESIMSLILYGLVLGFAPLLFYLIEKNFGEALWGQPTNMKVCLKILFSFQGRINRKKWWLGKLAASVLIFIAGVVLAATDWDAASETLSFIHIHIFFFPIFILCWCAHWALDVKRWHDRDKLGWWALIGLIPIIGSTWILIELGFCRGTDGRNCFGPDPLEYS